jgi:hypothetical protein
MYPPLGVGEDSGASWWQYLAPFSEQEAAVYHHRSQISPTLRFCSGSTNRPHQFYSLYLRNRITLKHIGPLPIPPPHSTILETECGNVLPPHRLTAAAALTSRASYFHRARLVRGPSWRLCLNTGVPVDITVNWVSGTMLQAEGSRVPFPIVSLHSSIDLIFPVALWTGGRLSSNRNEYAESCWEWRVVGA